MTDLQPTYYPETQYGIRTGQEEMLSAEDFDSFPQCSVCRQAPATGSGLCLACDSSGLYGWATAAVTSDDTCPFCHGSGFVPDGDEVQFCDWEDCSYWSGREK
jgi:hypothetical protein